MFVRQNQQQFRNSNADVKIFYGSGDKAGTADTSYTWLKPPGVSFVYFLLIGAGGIGNGTNGGGSGGTTVWFGSAQNVPDTLKVWPSDVGGGGTRVQMFISTGAGTTNLLVAGNGNGSTAGTAQTAGTFAASGFYQSIAGQSGTSGAQSASTTTFLSGGAGGVVTANYGYTNSTSSGGYFQLQPIIVGVASSNNGNLAGVGCGGSVAGDPGGQGMVLIASW